MDVYLGDVRVLTFYIQDVSWVARKDHAVYVQFFGDYINKGKYISLDGAVQLLRNVKPSMLSEFAEEARKRGWNVHL